MMNQSQLDLMNHSQDLSKSSFMQHSRMESSKENVFDHINNPASKKLQFAQSRTKELVQQKFFQTLKNEILQIPGLPLEDSVGMAMTMTQSQEDICKLDADVKNLKGDISEMAKHLRGQTDKAKRADGESVIQMEVDKQLNILDNLIEGQGKNQSEDIFGYERGRCRHCDFDECPHFQANNSLVNMDDSIISSPFSCLNCKCPMNSHKLLSENNYFSNAVLEMLQKKRILQNHINFSVFVAIFFVPTQHSKDINVSKIGNLVNQSGFQILSHYKCTYEEIISRLIQRKYLCSKKLQCNTEHVDNFSSLLGNPKLLEYSLKAKFGIDANHSILQQSNSSLNVSHTFSEYNNNNNQNMNWNPYQMHQPQPQYNNNANINNNLQTITSMQLQKQFRIQPQTSPQNTDVYIFAVSSKDEDYYTAFPKFIHAIRSHLHSTFQLYYSSKSKQNALQDIQVFFPDFFVAHTSSFWEFPNAENSILQKHNQTKEQEAMKDLLDFNLYTILKQVNKTLTSNDKKELQECFKLFTSNYAALVEHLVADGRLRLAIAVKFGPRTFFDMNSNMAPNLYRIADPAKNKNVFQLFLKEMHENQRVCIIFRPLIVKSNLTEQMLNMFRINKFTLISRALVQLTKGQAYFLSKIEGIHESNQTHYIELMTEGICEVVLLFRFGALQLAEAICNGCKTGLKKSSFSTSTMTAQTMTMDHVMQNNEVLKEIIPSNYYNVLSSLYSMNPFYGIRDIIQTDRLLFGTTQGDAKEKLVYDEHRGELQMHNFREDTVKRNPKKELILRQLQNGTFNFFVFSTQTEVTTEQLVHLFLPDCSKMQMATVIIKPFTRSDLTQTYRDNICKMIIQLGFKIVYRKPIKLIDEETKQLMSFLADDFSPNSPFTKLILEQWIDQEFEILTIIKPAARKEILSLLRSFSLFVSLLESPFENGVDLQKEDLNCALVPCWNDEAFFYTLALINPVLYNISGKTFMQHTYEDQNDILDYIMFNTYGDKINRKDGFDFIYYTNDLEDDEHLGLKVLSNQTGEIEVRIKNFDIQKTNQQQQDILDVKSRYTLTGWYYELVNKKFAQKCPISYHARVFPQDYTQFQPLQIFTCQQYCGGIFTTEILNMIYEQKQKPLENNANSILSINSHQLNTPLQKKIQLAQLQNDYSDRGSLISYLWGIKLANFVKAIEQIEVPSGVEGYGPLVITEENAIQMQGKSRVQNDGHVEMEFVSFKGILSKVLQQLSVIYEIEERTEYEERKQFEQQCHYQKEHLSETLNFIFNSSTYMLARQKNMFRVFPESIDEQHLRVLKDKDDIFSMIIHDEFATLNYYYEQESQSMQSANYEQNNYQSNQNNQNNQNINKTNTDRVAASVAVEDPLIQVIQAQKQEDEQALKEKQSLLQNKQMKRKQNKLYNDFAMANVVPCIKSKYQLLANINFLLNIQLSVLNSQCQSQPIQDKEEEIQLNLNNYNTNNNLNLNERHDLQQKEYFIMVSGLKEGFNNTYRVDQEDVAAMQDLYRKSADDSKNNKAYNTNIYQSQNATYQNQKKIPDLQQMELFLYSLKMLERSVDTMSNYIGNYAQMDMDQQKQMRDMQNQMILADRHEVAKMELQRQNLENTHKRQLSLLGNRIVDMKVMSRQLLEHIMHMDIQYAYADQILSGGTKQNGAKAAQSPADLAHQFSPQASQMFTTTYNAQNFIKMQSTQPPSYQPQHFKVKIAKEKYFKKFTKGRFDQQQLHDDQYAQPLNQQTIEMRQQQLRENAHMEIFKHHWADPIQQKWVERPPLLVSQLRPFEEEDPIRGVIVEKTLPQVEKKMQQAIDKEIMRYREFQAMNQQQIMKQDAAQINQKLN